MNSLAMNQVSQHHKTTNNTTIVLCILNLYFRQLMEGRTFSTKYVWALATLQNLKTKNI